MGSDGDLSALRARFAPLSGTVLSSLLVAVAYYLGAEAAFAVGTLSDQIFAPFWPPNIILFLALLLAPTERWWLYLAAVLPAHVAAEVGVGMGVAQLTVAFVSNCGIAIANAAAARALLNGPPWFDTLRKASLYVLITAGVAPACVAFAGALVPMLGANATHGYWVYWVQWYAANALGSVTLGAAFLTWMTLDGAAPLLPKRRWIEVAAIAISLIVVSNMAFVASAVTVAKGFIPTLLYLPLPIVLWAAARLGAKGASQAILILTVVLIWRTLNAPSLFAEGNPETNVLALQLFLLNLAVPTLLLGAAIDEARHAEQATRESEERITFAAASANIGLWDYSAATGRFWVTEHGQRMLGFELNAPITRDKLLKAVHPDDVDVATGIVTTAARSGAPAAAEFRILLRDGSTRWIHAVCHAQHDNHGGPERISGVFTDITARKTSEADAEAQRVQLAHLMRVSLVGELSGAIAHELNQPLTAILSNAQAARLMLSRSNLNITEICQTLDDIIEEDARAAEVITRVRSLLRKGESKFEPIDLNGVITSVARILHSELINRRMEIELDLTEGLAPVRGDAVQLQQVVLNLVMNAIESMHATARRKRTVTVRTGTSPSGRIEISVMDRGHGIAVEQHGLLMQPFFTTKEHGLGLGLSICSTIVRSHGGELKIANNAQGGATATVALPVCAAAGMEAAA